MRDTPADGASIAYRPISNTARDVSHQAERDIGDFAILDFGVGDTRTNREPIALNSGVAQLGKPRDIDKFVSAPPIAN